jgi:hypothetical protein
MHFNALLDFVPSHFMREGSDVEICVEFAIDSGEQVAVESGRHTENIIVGRQHTRNLFHQIGSDQQSVAGLEQRRQLDEESGPGASLEVADGASQKQKQHLLPRPPALPRDSQPFNIRIVYGVNLRQRGKFGGTGSQRGNGNVNRVIIDLSAGRERL